MFGIYIYIYIHCILYICIYAAYRYYAEDWPCKRIRYSVEKLCCKFDTFIPAEFMSSAQSGGVNLLITDMFAA